MEHETMRPKLTEDELVNPDLLHGVGRGSLLLGLVEQDTSASPAPRAVSLKRADQKE